MTNDRKLIEKTVTRALSGEGAHVGVASVFVGLDWKVAGVRPDGARHSLFELLNHMTFWQDWVVKWLEGKKPSVPKHAAGGWPGGARPAGPEEWKRAVRSFRSGLRSLDRRSREAGLLMKIGRKSRLEMLHAIASHNSYHVGQAVLLRQTLGAWPPPSGGLTW